MTKGGRIAAGVLTVIGGAALFLFFPIPGMITGAILLVGGSLLFYDKTAGAILALVGGNISLVLTLVPIGPFMYPFFFLTGSLIPSGLGIAGGIVALVVGPEFPNRHERFTPRVIHDVAPVRRTVYSPRVVRAEARPVLRYCPNCGNSIVPDARYCDRCGTELYMR